MRRLAWFFSICIITIFAVAWLPFGLWPAIPLLFLGPRFIANRLYERKAAKHFRRELDDLLR